MNNRLTRIDLSMWLTPLAVAAGLAGLALWSFWPTLAVMAQRWAHDPQYSHGYLVPLFALVLLWQRRGHSSAALYRPSWIGLPILAVALGLRLAAHLINFDWLEGVSFVLVVAGLFGILGGGSALRWSWPAVAFLLFMVPLPPSVDNALVHPLRSIATRASVYVLQTLGMPAVAQGYTITLRDTQLMVAEACSGLSMLMIFVALSSAVAILAKRPALDRLVILASAVPIALAANIARITVTGLMFVWVGHEMADLVFHDLAGWLMMPFALAILWLELGLLRRLFTEEAEQGPMPLTLPLGL